ncbi:MAG TPA: DUF6159 family protein [Gemmatales bacterium]|nr:DUF6159 family protein [Gemmatales bacterium]HMP60581.1 DUF6159 family protein [Gemmatales bacterium]
MFQTISRSWSIIGECWDVLKKQKTLLLFPVLSGLACLVVMLSFIAPMLLFPEWAERFMDTARQPQNATTTEQIVGPLLAFAFYFVNYFIIVYFNAALASCAIVHFKGGEPTMGDGLAAATRRLPQILAWALVAATVGMILKAIEQRAEKLGRFIVSLIGLAWSVATYLVVPVLAIEGVGPIDALKRSAAILRQKWGEGLAGNLSLGIIGFLACLPGFALIMVGVALGQAFLLLSAVGVLYLVAVGLVMSTLKQIYIAALYLYAAEGQIAKGFSADDMQQAFLRK